MENSNERWALFWCNLLHDAIFGHIESGGEGRYLRELSEKEHLLPNGKSKKISYSTLRRKLKRFREGGIEKLYRKLRSDRGKIRAVEEEIIEKAVELKKDQPHRSDEAINRFLEQHFGKTIARSTLYDHLRQRGATKVKLGISKTKVRKRWTKDNSNDLWMMDFEYGPYVMEENSAKQTYLSLCIDCHSRFVVHAKYYLQQNTQVVIDTLLCAWSTYGLCSQLYLDNAQTYKSKLLQKACYDLKVEILHRPVREPAPGGLVERIFSTIQTQFEKEVRASKILTLQQLNQLFVAYLNVAYNEKVHSETKQTPKERYQQGIKSPRHVDINKLNNYFLNSEERTVHRTFSDIQLHGLFFQVDPKLRGDKVQIRYPQTTDLKEILVYSSKGEYLGKGTLHQRTKSIDFPQTQQGPVKHDYLALLQNQHQQQIKKQASGIDYAKAQQKSWGFTDFLYSLASLMGRKGNTSAFTTCEFEVLYKIFQNSPKLNENLLITAFTNAQPKNIANIEYQLQLLFSKE